MKLLWFADFLDVVRTFFGKSFLYDTDVFLFNGDEDDYKHIY